MSDSIQDLSFGYCTNVHAGVTLRDAQDNLQKIAHCVRNQVVPDGRLPVGLWLPQPVAEQLNNATAVAKFRDWLEQWSFKAYTLNGFPQGDFHQAVVKHAVYEPTWLADSRRDYTCLLADILVGLLPPGHSGSISTLPLGWPHRSWQQSDFVGAAVQLTLVADHLDRIAQRTGHEIVLAIEPEPGCLLDTAVDMIEFLERYVLHKASEHVRRHITVCHDICHSAVMFESQSDALNAYAASGIRIGKVQVSSAVEVPWHAAVGNAALRTTMAEQLRTFDEPRYLHQTTRRAFSPKGVEMVEDLPVALRDWLPTQHGPVAPSQNEPTESWRVHFHLPIYTDHFGALAGTRGDIEAAVRCLNSHNQHQVAGRPWFTGHYEVETYAWGVLPPELKVPDLASGIAQELEYFRSILRVCTFV